jgi:hypothetical protein
MKKKEIKKIAKQIFKQFKLENESNQGKKVAVRENYEFSEYDSEVSDRFKKMIIQLIEYSDNLRINVDSEILSISISDINQLKSKTNSKNLNSDDDYLEISIIKNIGFSVSRGYSKRGQYKDIDIFNELEPLVKERLKVINKENFNNIWNTIMVDSGLIRDNNLLDILKDN